MTLRLDDALRAFAEVVAQQRGVTLSALAREGLRRQIEEVLEGERRQRRHVESK